MYSRWVDSHCHFLFDYSSAEKIQQMINELSELEFAVCISTEKNDFELIPKMITQTSNLYGMIGIHPDSAIELGDEELSMMKESILKNSKILGIGEIGLDYFREPTKKDIQIQKEAFEKQLQIALELNTPVVIHARDSIQDCLDILSNFSLKNSVVFHCFTGKLKEAEAILNQNYWISYTGAITYPKNTEIREAVAITPKECIMVETDSPFLAPVPFRGKQNHPIWVSYIGERVAEIKGWSIPEAKDITTSNAYQFFGLNS